MEITKRQSCGLHLRKEIWQHPTWPYYKSIYFLKNQFSNRPSSGNFSGNGEENEILSNEIREVEDIMENSSSLPPSPVPTTSRKRRHNDEFAREIMDIEREKVKYLQSKQARMEDDEDLNFFKSLLPHVKSLAPEMKLNFRIQLMQLLQGMKEPL